MNNSPAVPDQWIHVVDDDEAMRDSIVWMLESSAYKVAAFDSAEAFLAAYRPELTCCILLDVRMPGMSGLELFDELTQRRCTLPVIFITGHGDVPMAVAALKKGAFHFIEKPFNDHDLVALVEQAIALDTRRQQAAANRETIAARLASLTAREREVMQLILEGKYNKVIADELTVSMRTIEVHRARVFEKMAVRSAVELAQLLTQQR